MSFGGGSRGRRKRKRRGGRTLLRGTLACSTWCSEFLAVLLSLSCCRVGDASGEIVEGDGWRSASSFVPRLLLQTTSSSRNPSQNLSPDRTQHVALPLVPRRTPQAPVPLLLSPPPTALPPHLILLPAAQSRRRPTTGPAEAEQAQAVVQGTRPCCSARFGCWTGYLHGASSLLLCFSCSPSTVGGGGVVTPPPFLAPISPPDPPSLQRSTADPLPLLHIGQLVIPLPLCFRQKQALQLLRLSLSSEKRLLSLSSQIASLESELASLQDAQGRSVSSTLREMFSNAAGGRDVVAALVEGSGENKREGEGEEKGEVGGKKEGKRGWGGWGRS